MSGPLMSSGTFADLPSMHALPRPTAGKLQALYDAAAAAEDALAAALADPDADDVLRREADALSTRVAYHHAALDAA